MTNTSKFSVFCIRLYQLTFDELSRILKMSKVYNKDKTALNNYFTSRCLVIYKDFDLELKDEYRKLI